MLGGISAGQTVELMLEAIALHFDGDARLRHRPEPAIEGEVMSKEPKMQTLDEANAEAARRRSQLAKHDHGVGVACPKCGTEMLDSWPGTVTASDPPLISVVCPKCGHTGDRSDRLACDTLSHSQAKIIEAGGVARKSFHG